MAFQAVPNTLGLFIRGTFQLVPVENTFYYKYTPEITPAELAELTEAVCNKITSYWLPLLSTGFKVTEVYARDLAVEAAIQFTDTSLSGDMGAVTGDTLPNRNTLAVKRYSTLTGKNTRGRIFWFGFSESQVDNNYVDTDVVDDIVAAIQQIDTSAVSLGLQPVIVSRYLNGAKRATAVTYDIAAWAAVTNRICKRSSRMPEA